MCVRVCAYLCIWPYDWSLCVFGVCVCMSINCWCMFVFVYVVLWSMILCVCAFCVMIDACVCLYAYWPHWVAGAGLGDCVELLSSTSRPHVFSPSSHLPIQTLHHQIQTIYLQTLKHMNMQTYYLPSSHLTQTSNWNTSTSNIWTFKHSTSRPHVFSPSSHLPAPLSHTHTSNSNTSSSKTQTFQFPTDHMSPCLLHRLKHVRLLMLL